MSCWSPVVVFFVYAEVRDVDVEFEVCAEYSIVGEKEYVSSRRGRTATGAGRRDIYFGETSTADKLKSQRLSSNNQMLERSLPRVELHILGSSTFSTFLQSQRLVLLRPSCCYSLLSVPIVAPTCGAIHPFRCFRELFTTFNPTSCGRTRFGCPLMLAISRKGVICRCSWSMAIRRVSSCNENTRAWLSCFPHISISIHFIERWKASFG
jgi:hypothetical protein